MKKNISKYLLTLVTFVVSLLTVFVVSFSVSAADYTSGDWTYTVSNNKATITKYSGLATNITLPTTLGGYKVETIGNSAFKNNAIITSVTIPEGYTVIGQSAFYGCSYLKSVSIPKTIEYIGRAGYSWSGSTFQDCIRLETVTFAEGGKQDAYINEHAFSGCTALKSITIPANYKTIYPNAFYGCTRLETLVLKENSDKSITRSIDNSAFYNCTSLTSVAIPEGFTTIGQSAFQGCTHLKTVSIPKTIEYIGRPGYDWHGSTFQGCIRLETVTFAEGGKQDAYINEQAFSGCTALKSVTIPANYKSIYANAFNGCTNLQSLVIKENADKVITRYIGNSAFYNCTSLTSVVIPEGFTTIDQSAFQGCTNLRTVSIPKTIECIGRPGYDWHGSTFQGCIRLETVMFAEGGKQDVYINDNSFGGCTALKSVTIPANYKTIYTSAFENCTNLQTVIIKDNADEYFERSLGQNAFKGCSNLTQIHIPEGFTSIGKDCFKNCSSKLVICSTTTDCAAKTYATNNSIIFRVCNGSHGFVEEDTYTVNYYANGGSVTPASTKVIVGKSTTLPTPTKKVNITYNANGGSNAPSVQNCSLTCSGWATSSSATTGEFACGSSYKPTKDITLYAVWQKTTVTLTSSVPTRGGYKFLGWSRDASATTASYSAGGKMNVTGNVTLYAVWEKYSEGDIDGYVIGVKADDVVINYKSANAMVPVIIEHSGDVDYTVEYSSSNSSVATVDNKGNITATGTGETEITVTVTDEYGNVVEDTCTVTVSYAWWQWILIIVFFGWIWY